MKYLLLTIVLSLSYNASGENVKEIFMQRYQLSDEQIKNLRANKTKDKSYEIIEYEVKNKDLFENIIEQSSLELSKKILPSDHNYYLEIPTIQILKYKNDFYVRVDYNSVSTGFSGLYFPYKKIGYAHYNGRLYKIIFLDEDKTLFSPTNRVKKMKHDSNKSRILTSSYQFIFKIKGNKAELIKSEY